MAARQERGHGRFQLRLHRADLGNGVNVGQGLFLKLNEPHEELCTGVC